MEYLVALTILALTVFNIIGLARFFYRYGAVHTILYAVFLMPLAVVHLTGLGMFGDSNAKFDSKKLSKEIEKQMIIKKALES